MMYRGLVDISSKADNARNFTQCDSLLMGNDCGAHTIPYIKNKNLKSNIEHEATTSKISDDQLFYCNQRGLNQEEASRFNSQWFLQRSASTTSNGICSRGTES